MSALDIIRAYLPQLTAIRRDLHAHPELGNEERRTSDLVAGKLAEWGIETHRNIGGTGVVGVLRRGNGRGSVGLRADMDALPMREATGLPHGSRHVGRMHACGHDGHTTMLLGAARYLAEASAFSGTVHFIFQPAEEGLGGASAMLADGLFERFPCQSLFALHNQPGLPVGRFAIRPGPMMAGCGFFDIRVTGRGAHAARPDASVDPVLAAAAITNALQSIVSRNVDPADTAVLSVTSLQAGHAYNVIPETAAILGTVRSFRRETIEMMRSNMERVANHVAAGFGARAELSFSFVAPPLVNDEAQAHAIADAATALVGKANVDRNAAPAMMSEDFSFMLERKPGAYVCVGNGDSAPLHNDHYDFADAAIPFGAALYAMIAERKLAPGLASTAAATSPPRSDGGAFPTPLRAASDHLSGSACGTLQALGARQQHGYAQAAWRAFDGTLAGRAAVGSGKCRDDRGTPARTLRRSGDDPPGEAERRAELEGGVSRPHGHQAREHERAGRSASAAADRVTA